jgi:hypothetical protein
MSPVHPQVASPSERRWFRFSLLAVLILFVVAYLPSFERVSHQDDIYYVYVEGGRLAAGANPYARVLASDMRHNDKYATYLPGTYLAAAGLRQAGFVSFKDWLTAWRWALLGLTLATAAAFFRVLGPEQRWLALFFATFWLFNRWTLEVVRIAHIDVPALLAVIAALALLPRRSRIAGLLLGVSLAIKHIAVLLVPLFLIWAWQRRRRWRDVLEQGVWIALLPALLTLPFLLWDAEALLRTLLFPMTRLPAQTVGASSLDVRLGFVGLPAKLPMLLLFAGVYGLAWRGLVNRWAAAFLIFAVFTGYNSVLFPQYMVWPLTLLPLLWAAADPTDSSA